MLYVINFLTDTILKLKQKKKVFNYLRSMQNKLIYEVKIMIQKFIS